MSPLSPPGFTPMVAVLNTSTCVSERATEVVVNQVISQGRLPNSEILFNLEVHLSYLELPNHSDVTGLINKHHVLFSDVPIRTNVLKHNIVVDVAPIKQHPYRVNLGKHHVLCKEDDYMLQHGIAKPSFSLWNFPCLVADKSDNTPCFCSDFCKTNSVTKPDSYPLPRLDDCTVLTEWYLQLLLPN